MSSRMPSSVMMTKEMDRIGLRMRIRGWRDGRCPGKRLEK